MTDPHTRDDVLDDITDTDMNPDDPQSILDQLAAEVQDAAEARQDAGLKLLVPGMKTMYIGFKYVPRTDLSGIRKKLKGRRVDEIEALASAHLIAACVDEMFFSDDGGDTYQSVAKQAGMSAPMMLDEQLRTLILKLPASNARPTAAVQTVFDLYGNDHAIIDHAAKLEVWLKDTTVNATGDVLGG